jgi:hypothetical protein
MEVGFHLSSQFIPRAICVIQLSCCQALGRVAEGGLGRRKRGGGLARQAGPGRTLFKPPPPSAIRYEHAEKSGSLHAVTLVALELDATAGVRQHHRGGHTR